MTRVLPVVEAVTARHPERIVFTRFIRPRTCADLRMWRDY
jgi:hypothetical protein